MLPATKTTASSLHQPKCNQPALTGHGQMCRSFPAQGLYESMATAFRLTVSGKGCHYVRMGVVPEDIIELASVGIATASVRSHSLESQTRNKGSTG
eukprot:1121589-Amphidinium_carterae.1